MPSQALGDQLIPRSLVERGEDERLLAAVEDPQSLASRIGYVLGLNEQDLRALGERQRQRVASEFDIEHVWGRYRELYARIQDGSSET